MRARLNRLPGAVLRRGDLLLLALFWAVDVTGLSTPKHGLTRWGTQVPFWLGGALVTVTYLIAVQRYRRPLGVLATLGIATVVLPALLPDIHSFPPLLFALNAVASRLPRRVAVRALLATAVPMALLVAHDLSASSDPGGLAIFVYILYAFFTCLAWGLGIFAAEARARRTQAAVEAAHAAVSAERLRVARELHDIVAHAVSVIVVQAAGAQRVLESDPARARNALGHIESAGKQSMEELRRMLGALRGAGDGEPDGRSLDDLPALADQVRAAGTAVTLTEEGAAGGLAPSVALAAYRVVQEALTNTTRHAGVGASARVQLGWTPDRLQVTVEDTRGATPRDGVGMLSTGHGLLGLRERVEVVGGSLTTGPTATGYRLQADLPARPSTGTPSTTSVIDLTGVAGVTGDADRGRPLRRPGTDGLLGGAGG